MRNRIFVPVVLIILLSCKKDKDNSDSLKGINFKQEMREFVIDISKYAKNIKANFYIIPQNGIELVSSNAEENGSPDSAYLAAIDGNGQEDLFFGYTNDNTATPAGDNTYLRAFLDKSRGMGKTIFVTDYCSTHSYMDSSYARNQALNYLSFAANERELNNIPDYPLPVYGVNNAEIDQLSKVKNFLYLLNPENFDTKASFINAITATNYDLLIMDFFFQDSIEFTADEIEQMKAKANGGRRLVVSYLSIGEAENYRYYWNSGWNSHRPTWLESENPDWPGNYKVRYWEKDWQKIIYGTESSYLDKIISANFDGVYLDIIDAFEYFE